MSFISVLIIVCCLPSLCTMSKKHLHDRIMDLEHALNDSKSSERLTYLPKDRKIKTFSGKPRTDTDISVDDWIDDVESIFATRKRSIGEQVDLIYSHLEGEAKDEIKYRLDIRNNPDAILECLRRVFGHRESVTVLQKDFFDRIQRESETIRQYSYALLQLF